MNDDVDSVHRASHAAVVLNIADIYLFLGEFEAPAVIFMPDPTVYLITASAEYATESVTETTGGACDENRSDT